MIKKLMIPITLFISLIYSTTQKIEAEYYILLMVALVISFIAFSPLDLISTTWSPSTRILVSLTLLMLSSLVWIRNVHTSICIVFCSALMIAFAYRFNEKMMQNYNFYITKRQQVAISERSDMPCFKAWDSKGKRECDTMLREYMHANISSDDLEKIARPSYLIGYLTAQEKDNAAVQGELKDVEKSLANFKADYDELQRVYNQLVDDYNELQSKNYQLQLSLNEKKQIEAIKEKKIDIDSEIVRLKTEEPTLSLQAIADRVGSKKSHVQYVLKKAM